MSYFRPDTPPYKLKHLVEREAQRFRSYLGLSPDGPIDPFEVAEWMGLEVTFPDRLTYLAAEACRHLLADDGWSGATYHLPDAMDVVLLNPTHSRRRLHATLMEEVGHIRLRHAPSTLAYDETVGGMRRSYDRRQEQEAYWFGSATLVPKCGLRSLYEQGYGPAEAADYYRTSQELIMLRTNLHGFRKLARCGGKRLARSMGRPNRAHRDRYA